MKKKIFLFGYTFVLTSAKRKFRIWVLVNSVLILDIEINVEGKKIALRLGFQ